jgi:type IV pilus assembly protein PilZ
MLSKKTITARFPIRQAFMEAFSRRGPRGVFFVETTRRLEIAEQVTVVVEFPTDHRSFRLNGKVVARRRGSREPVLPPGVEVEFPADENQTLQLILDHSEGKTINFVDRRSRRMACSFVVSYGRNDEFVREFAEDIGEGGTFIRTEQLLPVGTRVLCKLKPPGYLLGVRLWGRVAWLKTTGQPKGMGVEFIFSNERQRKKIREIVHRLILQRSKQIEKQMKKLRQTKKFHPTDEQ